MTVVRAATSPLALDTNQCTPIDGVSVDCTDGADAGRGRRAGLHRVVFARESGRLAGCALLRVTTASKDTGLANATGIGFWSAQAADGNQAAEDSGRFVPKAALKAVGTATLRNGAPATLHEFVGVANCPLGGGSVVRPTVQAVHAIRGSGRWQDLPQLGPAPRTTGSAATITQFDRSGDVLRP